MKSHIVKLKEVNMLCNKCVLHVLKVLTKLEEIQELEIDLDKKLIKIMLNDDSITKEMVATMVYNAVEGVKPRKLSAIN